MPSTGTDCHSPTVNYEICMREAFAAGTPSGVADVFAHYNLIASVVVAVTFLAAAWMTLAVYNAFASKSISFNQGILSIIRIIILATLVVYIVV